MKQSQRSKKPTDSSPLPQKLANDCGRPEDAMPHPNTLFNLIFVTFFYMSQVALSLQVFGLKFCMPFPFFLLACYMFRTFHFFDSFLHVKYRQSFILQLGESVHSLKHWTVLHMEIPNRCRRFSAHISDSNSHIPKNYLLCEVNKFW
jgi:hypothetical protein